MTRALSVLCLVLALAAAPGCRRDQLASAPHPRVVSFSPAITRLIFDMGLGDHVVGVTSYCRLPKGVSRPVVGSNLDVRIEPILAANPDMVLIQMAPSYFDALHRVRPNLPIERFTSDSLSDIADAMERIGMLLGKPDIGVQNKMKFLGHIESLRKRTSSLRPVPTLFVLGYQNLAGPGSGTFIDEMITLAGGRNVLADEFKGWAKPSLETILKHRPEVIVCQCKSEDARDAAAYWRALDLQTPGPQRVFIVTDDDWTLPADHLADYAERLTDFIHPPQPTEPAP